jgi:uncharacterized protein (DUF1330 family)
MAGYLVAFVKLKDATRLQEYSSAAAPTIAAAGGSIVTRAKFKVTLAGDFSADSCLIVKFPTAAAAQDWYQSPAYQALIPLRDQVLQPTFILLEDPT